MALLLFLDVSALSRFQPRTARGSLAKPRCGPARGPKFDRKHKLGARTGARCEPNGFDVPHGTLECGSLPIRTECEQKREAPADGAGAAEEEGGVQEEVPGGDPEDGPDFRDDQDGRGQGGQDRGDRDQGRDGPDGKLQHHCVGLVQPRPPEPPRTPTGTKERKPYFSSYPLHL